MGLAHLPVNPIARPVISLVNLASGVGRRDDSRLVGRFRDLGLIRLPAVEAPRQNLAGALEPRDEDGRVVPACRCQLPMSEHGAHVGEINPALAELQRHTVPRLIRPHVLRPAGGVQFLGVVAPSKEPHASALMNAFHAAAMSSFSQNARGSPPLAVRTIHALRSRSTSAGSARFSSAGRTPFARRGGHRDSVDQGAVRSASSRRSSDHASSQFDDDNEVRRLGYIGKKRYTRFTITPAANASAAGLPRLASGRHRCSRRSHRARRKSRIGR